MIAEESPALRVMSSGLARERDRGGGAPGYVRLAAQLRYALDYRYDAWSLGVHAWPLV